MPKPIWPIPAIYIPFSTSLHVDAFINNFGDGFEQRIVNALPRGPRADGEGILNTFVGRFSFSPKLSNLRFPLQGAEDGNTNLDSSVRKLWKFYRERFYDSVTDTIKWESFYFYNLDENDKLSTWTGDTASSGTNGRGEAVTEKTGRYLTRFGSPDLTRERFVQHLFQITLELIEVDD